MKKTLYAAVAMAFCVVVAATPVAALDREELVTIVASDAGISEIEARRAVAAVFDVIIEFVSQGELVLIEGFGGFRTTQGVQMKSPLFIPDNRFRNAVK